MAYKQTNKRRKQLGNGSVSHNHKAILILAVAIALLIILGVVNFEASSEQEKIDPVTFCKRDKSSEITVILIDHTDIITTIQKAALENRLWDIVNATGKNSKIKLYEVNNVNAKVLSPAIDVCNPGNENDVNEFTGNKMLAHKKFEERFRKPLKVILDGILSKENATNSPIMGAVQSVAVTSFIGEEQAAEKKRFILVSDLLENTKNYSLYKSEIDFENFKSSEHWKSIRSDLNNVDVEIFFLRRNGADKFQNTNLRKFWINFFEEQGAIVSRFLPIEG